MDKAIKFLRQELGDLERLMVAIENALERKQATPPEPVAAAASASKTGVFGQDPVLNSWVD